MELGAGQAGPWALFKEEFNSHFFVKVVQEAKAKKFMDLVQGRMIVTEYAAKFTQVLRFTVYIPHS